METATFSNSQTLADYLEFAFQFEVSGLREKFPGLESKEFIERALGRIHHLQVLQTCDSPPVALTQALDTLTAELIAYLKRNPEMLYELDPRAFEKLIAEILSAHGWKVHLTARTNDGGYDLFAIEENGALGLETSWLVECKRYAPDRPVGVDVVRALYGSNIFMGKSAGAGAAMKLLATTSYFTKGAHDLKASTYDLALKDYEGILDWLNTYRPNPNGKLYLKDNRLVVPAPHPSDPK